MNDNPDQKLDALFAAARATAPDTSRAEYGFETRLAALDKLKRIQDVGFDDILCMTTPDSLEDLARLRDKLGPEAKRVITVKNVGYRFDTE